LVHRGFYFMTVPSPDTAILLPGQGSHVPGMDEAVRERLPDLLAQAIALIGEDPFPRAADSTRFAQPAIYLASLAGWDALKDRGAPARAIAMAGHSLGEFAALVAAGALTPEDGLRLIVRRGELMADAAEQQGNGTMLALLKGTHEQAREIAEQHDVSVANDNANGQLVLAGPEPALREAMATARAAGLRAMLLDVAGAFHSPAMAPARDGFQELLATIEITPPRVPVMSGATAQPFQDIRSELADGLVQPVRWREVMDGLAALGATAYLDVGPGTVLARLVPRTRPEAQVLTPEDLEEVTDHALA
jgi:[acyl-carrier-protein] S-malonyltransferase